LWNVATNGRLTQAARSFLAEEGYKAALRFLDSLNQYRDGISHRVGASTVIAAGTKEKN
jgi:hypothetical protein